MGVAVMTSRPSSSSSRHHTQSQSQVHSQTSRPRSVSPKDETLNSCKAPPSPRTAEKYARMFDRALAARYVADLKARARAAGAGDVPLSTLIARADQDHAHARAHSSEDHVAPAFIPRMEMYECEVDSDSALNPNTGAGSSRRVTATLELPGMKKEALRIEVRNGQLVIQGDRLPPAHMHTHAKRRRLPLHSATVLSGPGVPPPAPADSHIELHDTCRAAFSEIRYGRFRRVLTLPLGLDAMHIQANMQDGLLVVSWPVPDSYSHAPTSHVYV